ncbi:hypothetical protein [Bradyrhizobium sp. AUGA SZCCT0274]|jgi:hypothetical protein|uniref:hypothetical protein n=1 Tax=unclassified Bradyrhizobium TaxID=2631580 RepID=UPI0039089897
MGHQLVYRVAVDGKPPVSKTGRTSDFFAYPRRLTIAAVAFFMTSLAVPASYAQSSGPYAGMAGKWAGAGTVTLDDGSNERIRCRAVYDVAGAKMDMSLTCASDAYRFNLTANVVDQGGAIVGQWSETSRGITGSLQGRGGGGNFQVTAVTAGFNANIALKTAGNKQSVSIRADSQFRAANISLSK